MRALAASGMTMLVVTHEMAFARDVSSQVVFMADGRICESGAPDAFFSSPASPEPGNFWPGLWPSNRPHRASRRWRRSSRGTSPDTGQSAPCWRRGAQPNLEQGGPGMRLTR